MPGEQKCDPIKNVEWLPWDPIQDPTGPHDLIGRHFLEVKFDLFGPDVTDDQRDAAFAAMMVHSRHIFRVVTSFPAAADAYLQAVTDAKERSRRLAPTVRNLDREFSGRFDAGVERLRTPPECWTHVWLMLRARTQDELDVGLPFLLVSSAAVRGVLLDGPTEPINLSYRLDRIELPDELAWVVLRGQTGPDAKPTHPDIARSVLVQCATAGVPFCFEGWGEWGTACTSMTTRQPVFRMFSTFGQWVDKASTWVAGGICLDRHGKELRNGADFMAARDEGRFPVTIMHRVGADRSGRLLNGQTWEQFPEVCRDR